MKQTPSNTPRDGTGQPASGRRDARVKVKTKLRAGAGVIMPNHNETLALVSKAPPSAGIKLKTRVRAGKLAANHNETLARLPGR